MAADSTAPVAIRTPARGLPKPARTVLRDLTPSELADWLAEHGAGPPPVPRFRAAQLFQWLHHHRAGAFCQMTNLPAAMRQALSEQAQIGALSLDQVQRATDGTRKLRLSTPRGRRARVGADPETRAAG